MVRRSSGLSFAKITPDRSGSSQSRRQVMAAESVQGLNAKVSGQRFGGFLLIEPGRPGSHILMPWS